MFTCVHVDRDPARDWDRHCATKERAAREPVVCDWCHDEVAADDTANGTCSACDALRCLDCGERLYDPQVGFVCCDDGALRCPPCAARVLDEKTPASCVLAGAVPD